MDASDQPSSGVATRPSYSSRSTSAGFARDGLTAAGDGPPSLEATPALQQDLQTEAGPPAYYPRSSFLWGRPTGSQAFPNQRRTNKRSKADELFRAQATFSRRGTLRGVELWEVRMTITLFDPRTGKPVTITVPDRPSLQPVIRTAK